MTEPVSQLPPEVVLRLGCQADRKFIASSWFQSYRLASQLPFDIYKQGQSALIDRLLATSYISVAVAREEPEEILGYSLYDEQATHYVYVKQAYRRLGIGKVLASLGSGQHSHETPVGRRLAAKVRSRYNPYLLVNPPLL